MKNKYEIRQLDCFLYDDDQWIENTSYYMGEMATSANDTGKALTQWLKSHKGIAFKKNRTRIEFDDCYTIVDRKTKEPLFIAIPLY